MSDGGGGPDEPLQNCDRGNRPPMMNRNRILYVYIFVVWSAGRDGSRL